MTGLAKGIRTDDLTYNQAKGMMIGEERLKFLFH